MNAIGNQAFRYWAKKADEARTRANAMSDAKARALMVKAAKRYELMASIAAKQPSKKER